jgi:hypothetical protein
MAKRKIPKVVFPSLDDLDSNELESDTKFKELLKREAPISIQIAFEQKKLFATLFEINNTGQFIDIPKQYWIEALNTCIESYVKNEEYEKANETVTLIEKIKKGNLNRSN